mmetsp:Transcript_12811/g.31908  ORF Transcript_12811/g.31908 Transcript_12811/m.31908 type:complete len:243 (+) Transcript_12811:1997-2725(+)
MLTPEPRRWGVLTPGARGWRRRRAQRPLPCSLHSRPPWCARPSMATRPARARWCALSTSRATRRSRSWSPRRGAATPRLSSARRTRSRASARTWARRHCARSLSSSNSSPSRRSTTARPSTRRPRRTRSSRSTARCGPRTHTSSHRHRARHRTSRLRRRLLHLLRLLHHHLLLLHLLHRVTFGAAHPSARGPGAACRRRARPVAPRRALQKRTRFVARTTAETMLRAGGGGRFSRSLSFCQK